MRFCLSSPSLLCFSLLFLLSLSSPFPISSDSPADCDPKGTKFSGQQVTPYAICKDPDGSSFGSWKCTKKSAKSACLCECVIPHGTEDYDIKCKADHEGRAKGEPCGAFVDSFAADGTWDCHVNLFWGCECNCRRTPLIATTAFMRTGTQWTRKFQPDTMRMRNEKTNGNGIGIINGKSEDQ